MAYFRLWNGDKKCYKKEFYYTHLSGIEQNLYEDILDAVIHLRKGISVTINISAQQLADIYYRVLWDNPHICYVNSGNINIGTGAISKNMQFDYLFPLCQCRDIQNVFQNSVEEIVRNLDLEGLGDFEKELFLHDYMVENLSYDFEALQKRMGKDLAHSVYGAVINKKAVCQGIAAMFKVLADLAGLESIFVSGALTGEVEGDTSEPHSWNIVCMEGEYVHLDVTNDLNIDHKKSRYLNFNFNDRQAIISYIWDRQKYPACGTMRYYYYEYFHMTVNSVEELKTYIRRRRDKKILEICFGEDFPLPEGNVLEYIGKIVIQEFAKYYKNVQVEYEWIQNANVVYIRLL